LAKNRPVTPGAGKISHPHVRGLVFRSNDAQNGGHCSGGWILLEAPDRRSGGTLLRVFSLLFLSVLINYVDRGNLSVAAPLLKDELHLSASKLGVLLAAFFWTYSSRVL
jgi:hypothetical protein